MKNSSFMFHKIFSLSPASKELKSVNGAGKCPRNCSVYGSFLGITLAVIFLLALSQKSLSAQQKSGQHLPHLSKEKQAEQKLEIKKNISKNHHSDTNNKKVKENRSTQNNNSLKISTDKYRLNKIQKDHIERILMRRIRDPRLRKQGILGSSRLQFRLVVLAPSEKKKQKPLHSEIIEIRDSPLAVLDKQRKQMENDTYFSAILKANQIISDYRYKNGKIPRMPTEVRRDLIYLNRLEAKRKVCDKEGNCLYIFSYTKRNLRSILQSSFD